MRKLTVKVLKSLHLYRPIVSAIQAFEQPLATWWAKQKYQNAWRRRAIPFYAQFIKQGDLCFDIGANVGSRTEVFHRLGARVIAVEPQPECARGLRRKYHNGKVKVIQTAIGSHVGNIEMMVNSKYNPASSCSKEWVRLVKAEALQPWVWDKSITVNLTTLDKLIAQYGVPTFCKIDVEGFEHEVIKGLSKPVKAVSLEFHPTYLPPIFNSLRKLNALGLTFFNYSLGESMQMELKAWVGIEEICGLLAALPTSNNDLFGDVYAKG